MSSSEIQVSLRGKVLDTSQKLEYGEVEAWTPFNSDLQMQGIKVLVTDPLPDQKKGDMFEGTMLLLGMIKDKQENENKRMKGAVRVLSSNQLHLDSGLGCSTAAGGRMDADKSLAALKGKILEKPRQHIWRINKQKEDQHKYTCELHEETWTPYNSNLHMQGIKVLVKDPPPISKVSGGAFEDTMMLLELLKEQRQGENQKLKEEKIREMAMEQKRKKEAEMGRRNY